MERTEPGRAAWPPSGWSLRTKISVVLLLPVIVALTLAGTRIESELTRATDFSTVRDQLPVLRDITDLADLVNQESVATVTAGRAGLPTAQIDAVDAKAAELQRDADFGSLSPETSRVLNTAIGRLGVLRNVNSNRDPVGTTAGYRDIVFALANTVPAFTTPTADSELDRLAFTGRNLLQLRGSLAVQEGLLRSIGPGTDQAVITSAAQAAAEESALRNQVQASLTGDQQARFATATASSADRQAALQSALATDRTTELSSLLLPIAAESAGLGDVLTELITGLSTAISDQTDDARSTALRDASLVIGALLAALAIALFMARSVVSPMRRLHAAALSAAHEQLPRTIERVRSGDEVSWQSVEPVGITTGEEIGQLAHAFDEMHQQAVRLAA